MKRLTALLLVVILLPVMLLSACGGEKKQLETSTVSSTQAESSNTTEATAASANEPSIFPVVKEKVTLHMFTGTNVPDFANNAMSKWYEEKTNVHVEWETCAEEAFCQKRDLMMASNTYPDIFFSGQFSNAQLMVYGAEGKFLALNDLIDKDTILFRQIMQDIPEIKQLIATPDGKIYALPEVNQAYHVKYYDGRAWIYQPWLDKLGLKMPETTDEYYQILKAFKEQDPNGNGKQDEISLAGTGTGSMETSLTAFLMNSFTYNDLDTRLYPDNGTLKACFMQPEWKEGLKFLRKLYSEGLIAPETFIQGQSGLLKMGEHPDVPILGSAPAGHPGTFTKYKGSSGRFEQYTAIPPLEGPNGVRHTIYKPYNFVERGRFVITDKCATPEIAIKWADGLYDKESSLRNMVGRLGVEWRWAEPGEVGINGEPAIWTQLDTKGTDTESWKQSSVSFLSEKLRLGQTAVDPKDIEVMLYKETKNKYEGFEDMSLVIPPLYFNAEESSEIAEMWYGLAVYMNDSFVKFVTGDLNIDSDWDSYIDELKNNYNADRYIEIYQKAYDSQVKK